MSTPTTKFTVITSTFNAESELKFTADSLAAQTCRDFQWIIADGGSTDGTLAEVERYRDIVSVIFSGKDRGIYDAWNKAIGHVAGEWVMFLGAGDVLHGPEVLARVAEALRTVPDHVTTVYGSVLMVSAPGESSGRLFDTDWQGVDGPWISGRPVIPCHQGVFHRASLFRDGFRFDDRMRISADTELVLGELVRGHGQKIDLLVSRFTVGGISQQKRHRLRKLYEVAKIDLRLGLFRRRPIYLAALLLVNALKHPFRRPGT